MLLERLFQLLAKHAVLIAFVLSVLAFGKLLIERIDLIDSYHPDIGGVEPNIIYGIQRVMDGGPLYTDPNQPPYSIIMYSPLYFHVCAAVGHLIGVDHNEPYEVYKLSRSLSLVFNLTFVFFILLISRSTFRMSNLVGLITAALCFLYLRITDFGRPDSLYHLVFLSGIYLSFRHSVNENEKRGYWLLGLASFASILALFTKQSGLILPVIIIVYLLLNHTDKRQIGISLVVMIASFFLLLLAFTGGNFYEFFQNTYQGVNNGISYKDWFYPRILLKYTREINVLTALILALAGFLLISFKERKYSLLALAIWGTFSFGLLTSLKWGSMPSYFTLFICFGFVAISLFLNDLFINKYQVPKQFLQLFFLGIVVFCTVTELPHKIRSLRDRGDDGSYEQAQQIHQYLHHDLELAPNEWVMTLVDGHTLLDWTYINNFEFRNAILPTKDIITCCSYKLKSFDYSYIEENSNKGLVKYLIKKRDSYWDTYFELEFTNFKLIKEFDQYWLFEYSE